MKDRHKYRVWHKPTQQMYDVFSFCEELVKVKTEQETIKLSMSDCELMQCTGVEDDGLQTVYEGDIVADYPKKHFGVVRWRLGSFYIIPAPFSLCLGNTLFEAKNSIPFQVVGNVYQNPELLEDKQ